MNKEPMGAYQLPRREIKFRAWMYGKMEYDPSCQFNDPEINFEFEKSGDRVYMQYTGLKDKNGVEIYEGDIVSYQGKIYYIEYNTRTASFRLVDRILSDYVNHCESSLSRSKKFVDGGVYEVVGNVFENPELLEAQHETTSS